jgi:heme exporter protein C|uniref:ABC transporter subunit C n=1 Tax=Diphylleia rotans TaxID=190327 RepID=A0A146I7U9_9EUKA|nr:ABC transporter subunit C [Diphylleia rotans]BAU71475.1 ABC transporter subunit C [Diphylleia rotans]
MNTNHILYTTRSYPIWTLSTYFLILLISGGYLLTTYIESDFQQDDFFKIIYCHVPCAWLALQLFAIMLVLAITYLIKKNPIYLIFIKTITGVGTVFSILTLITGSLWAKPIWGSYWVWDSRLTTMFILSIIYIAILFSQSEKIQLGLIFLGSINLPIIKYSVDWWNSLHQPSTFKHFTIAPEMFSSVILIYLGLLALTLLTVSIELRIAILNLKIGRYDLYNLKKGG